MIFEIEGWASTDRVDRGGNVVRSEAFARYLKDYMNSGGVLLLNHDRAEVVGKVLEAKIKERGLWIHGIVFTEDKRVQNALSYGALTALSVGFISLAREPLDFETGGFEYKDGILLEISLTAVPANPDATFRIVNVYEEGSEEARKFEVIRKSAADAGELLTSTTFTVNVSDIEVIKKEQEKGEEFMSEEKKRELEMTENTTDENKEDEADEVVEVEKGVHGFSAGDGVQELKNILSKFVKADDVNAKEIVRKSAKSTEQLMKNVEKELVEKAVNTLGSSPQFGTTAKPFIFDGLQDGKLFNIPNLRAQMTTSMLRVPILGEADVAEGESGVNNDSGVGTNAITLTLKQFSARYPVSYLLETVSGGELVTSINENMKKSIGRKFDRAAWTTLTSVTKKPFNFTTLDAKKFFETFVNDGGEMISDPANCVLLVDPKAYSWLSTQDALYTVDKVGNTATILQGTVTLAFGMQVIMVPITSAKAQAVIVNRDYIASGQMGDVSYVSVIDSTGTNYLIARALLAFGKADTGGILFYENP